MLSITYPHMDQDDGAAKAKKLFECRLAAHEITAEIIESGFQKSQNKPPAAQVEIKLRGDESLTFGNPDAGTYFSKKDLANGTSITKTSKKETR